MLSMLIAYNAGGEIVATLDHLVSHDAAGNVVGLVDFGETEAVGTPLTEVWQVEGAAGSGAWPEWIGSRALEFRVELEDGFTRTTPRGERPDHRIRALVHRRSGHRRARAAVEQAIAQRIVEAEGRPADIRDLVGGPLRPIRLDRDGLDERPGVVPVLVEPRPQAVQVDERGDPDAGDQPA